MSTLWAITFRWYHGLLRVITSLNKYVYFKIEQHCRWTSSVKVQDPCITPGTFCAHRNTLKWAEWLFGLQYQRSFSDDAVKPTHCYSASGAVDDLAPNHGGPCRRTVTGLSALCSTAFPTQDQQSAKGRAPTCLTFLFNVSDTMNDLSRYTRQYSVFTVARSLICLDTVNMTVTQVNLVCRAITSNGEVWVWSVDESCKSWVHSKS